MTQLEIKAMSPKVLAKVVELAAANPLGHALRAHVACELGMTFTNALDVIHYLRSQGDVKVGATINDYWVKPNT